MIAHDTDLQDWYAAHAALIVWESCPECGDEFERDGNDRCPICQSDRDVVPTAVDTGMQHGPALDELATNKAFAQAQADSIDPNRNGGHLAKQFWQDMADAIPLPPISGGAHDADDTLTADDCHAIDELAIAADQVRDVQRILLVYAPDWAAEDQATARVALKDAQLRLERARQIANSLGIDCNTCLYAASERGYSDRFDRCNPDVWREIARQSPWTNAGVQS